MTFADVAQQVEPGIPVGDRGSNPFVRSIPGPRLTVRPLELRELNAFVEMHHRHHKKVQGHKFSLGAYTENGDLVGACSVGRPVARLTDAKKVAEVTRLVTDGTKNACSVLYAAAARACKAIGLEHIQTFILESELGTSLRASGWSFDLVSAGGQWKHTNGKPRRTDQPTCAKHRYRKHLNSRS